MNPEDSGTRRLPPRRTPSPGPIQRPATTPPVPHVMQQIMSMPDLFAASRGTEDSPHPRLPQGSYFSAPSPTRRAPTSLRPRSNSMDATHATSGGIHSRLRLELPDASPTGTQAAPLYRTTMSNTSARSSERPRDTFGVSRRGAPPHFAISSNDAEVQTLHEAHQRVPTALRHMHPGQTAHLEFHGNEGPCNDCKQRIASAAQTWSQHLPSGGSLMVHTYYSQPPQDTVRGRESVPTTYGWHEDARNPRVQYGSSGTPLYHHVQQFNAPADSSSHNGRSSSRGNSPQPNHTSRSATTTPHTRSSPASSGVRRGGRGQSNTTHAHHPSPSSTSHNARNNSGSRGGHFQGRGGRGGNRGRGGRGGNRGRGN